MTDRRERYVVILGGLEHTMLLTAEGAQRYGDSARKAATPKRSVKARTPQNKGQESATK